MFRRPCMGSIRTLFVMVCFSAVVSSLAGCAGGGVQIPDPVEGTTDVIIDDLAFEPKNVTINVGESVRWINAEGGLVPIPHSSTSGDPSDDNEGDVWDSGTIRPGDSFTRQFNEEGVFEYFCTFHAQHPEMRNATVTVVEAVDGEQ
jgi:plastocyanin